MIVQGAALLGSPPHAWGIQPHPALRLIQPRFTPTRVGNTLATKRSTAGSPVHPHTRGEYAPRKGRTPARNGSPPHAWGIRSYQPDAAWRKAVHPHTRGEYRRLHAVLIAQHGSPPHAWGIRRPLMPAPRYLDGSPPHAWGIRPQCGTQTSQLRFTPTRVGNTRRGGRGRRRRRRFTPTRVGNTTCSSAWVSSAAVHPHTRGEYEGEPFVILPRFGSPPHAWGIRRVGPLRLLPGRFTPTRVGNTLDNDLEKARPQVHPHTRGEYSAVTPTPES